jgi:hypothetical protein
MTAAILEFRQQDKRCCKCVHWTPRHPTGPLGMCEVFEDKRMFDWTCENWKSDDPRRAARH